MPPRRLPSIALIAAVVFAASIACERAPESSAVRTVESLLDGAQYIDGPDTLPRIQYADGSVTPNDRCMVRQVKLNRKLPPVFVNGLPIGFC